MSEPERVEYVMRTVEVKHIAKPYGPGRENPPHLWDLRRFVAACEGLPDTLIVYLQKGQSGENGRHAMTFSVKQVLPVLDEEIAPVTGEGVAIAIVAAAGGVATLGLLALCAAIRVFTEEHDDWS